MLLDFRNGDPRRPPPGRVVEDGSRAVSVAGRVVGYLPVHLRQRLDFAMGGLGLPRGKPLGVGGFGAASLPGEGAARLVLAAAGVLPGLLVQQPQRAPARRDAVAGFILGGQPLQSPVIATERELNRSITSWPTPPTSAPLPSERGTIT